MFAPQHAMLPGHLARGGMVEQAQIPRHRAAHQARLRPSAQWARSVGQVHDVQAKQEADGLVPGSTTASRDFSNIPVTPLDQASERQSSIPYLAAQWHRGPLIPDAIPNEKGVSTVTGASPAETFRHGSCSCGDMLGKESPPSARSMKGVGPASGLAVDDAGAPPPPVNPTAALPGAPFACLVTAKLPSKRSGIIRDATGFVGESFEVEAEWQSTPAVGRGETSYCAAEVTAYNQFVKGHMRSSSETDGSKSIDVSPKLFGGMSLDEYIFREDGRDDNPDARYGHRDEQQTMSEKYEPTRREGTKYTGKDFPHINTGIFADLDLSFRGDIVDTYNKAVSSSATWRVQYRGLIRP
jgi:hypothetical protein